MRLLLALLASLLLSAAPAMAQEPTVGEGQVITDQASETEDVPYAEDGTPAPEPEPDATGRRGEIHVLDAKTTSQTPSKAALPAPARPTATPRRSTLPFTGVNAGVLALMGLALLGSGLALSAYARPGTASARP